MDDNICEQCGTRNEPGAQFCVECQAFLPWYDTGEANLQALGIDTGTGTATAGSPADVAPTAPVVETTPAIVTPSAQAAADRTAGAPVRDQASSSGQPRSGSSRSPEPADQVRVAIEPASAEVVPAGDEVRVDVQIYNLSPIVDAYRVTAPEAPPWLTVGATEVRLLPNSNELASITLKSLAGVQEVKVANIKIE